MKTPLAESSMTRTPLLLAAVIAFSALAPSACGGQTPAREFALDTSPGSLVLRLEAGGGLLISRYYLFGDGTFKSELMREGDSKRTPFVGYTAFLGTSKVYELIADLVDGGFMEFDIEEVSRSLQRKGQHFPGGGIDSGMITLEVSLLHYRAPGRRSGGPAHHSVYMSPPIGCSEKEPALPECFAIERVTGALFSAHRQAVRETKAGKKP